ncbi:uncharacterized protein [Parasteatoda tepidariorum]|uniref:uncharacterized protein isoform X2 n=1 Tax=Parasteatoda tepidariorum TaxID=114398 RepID=UPI001C717CD8|nr:uncharacterized protein LOC107438876 isoform X2 [Parasteatoda tepidariorum]
MDSYFDIEAVNNLGTLNSFGASFTSLKLVTHPHFHSNKILYVFFSDASQITCYKLSDKRPILSSEHGSKEYIQNSSLSLRFQQTLRFCVPLLDIASTNDDVWAIGNNCLLSIRNVFENKNSVQTDDCMEPSMKREYPFYGFETLVSANSFQEHIFQKNFYCFKCDLIENSILVCHENTELSSWQIVLVINSSTSTRNNLECIKLLSFPSSYSSENALWGSNKERVGKPEVLFSDSKHPLWKNICDSKTRSLSNYVVLIAQPDGTILYSLCSWACQRKEFKQVSSLQKLCKLEEPILCFCFRENIVKSIRSSFMIIIGEKGKLLLVTSEKLPSDADSNQLVNGLWILSWQLPSSVQSFIILDDCIIYCSFKGEVWITKFYANDSQEDGIGNQCIKITNRASDFKNICSLSLINKEDGLFIMVTNTGNMYLMKYSNKTSLLNNRSLPVLMNGILEQSMLLKDLASVKHSQSRLFVALSTFANIKFGAINKLRLDCKITEVEDFSKKLLINISLDGLQHFNLDTELWMISASIFSNFQTDSAIVTKCSPLVLGQTLHLEVLESNFCPSYSSLFPLYLEVGLILRGPKSFMSIDCFTDIVKKLPLYIKTNTAILTELYLLKNKSKILQNSRLKNAQNINILQEISNNNARNPLYKKENHVPEVFIPIFNKYTYCLLESTAEEFVKNLNKEVGLEESIFQAILERGSLSPNSDGNNLLCRDQSVSLSVFQIEKIVNINITTESMTILGLKTAIAELLLSNQPKSIYEASNCVSIPANILKKCEELSKELRSMYGQNVNANDFLGRIFKIYCKLRKEVSEKLPL